MSLPRRLTRQRVEAIITLAMLGDDVMISSWEDDWDIDIDVTDAEIREQAAEAELDEGTLATLWEDVRTLRQGRAARQILRRRVGRGKP